MSLFGNVWAFARVAASSVVGASKAVLVNLERDDGRAVEKSPEGRSFGPLGVYGRPEPPTAAQSGNLAKGECEALCARSMDGFEPIVYRDLRITRRMNPAIGEVGITQYGGGFLSLRWDRDRMGTVVTLSAPRLDSSDEVTTSHYLVLDPSAANNAIMLVHRSGSYLSMNKNGETILASSDGKATLTLKPGGKVVIGGQQSFLGGILAGNPGAAEPVALAAAYEAAFQAALPILLAAAAAVNGIAPGSVTPAQIAEITARVAALPALGKSTVVKASPT